MTFIQKYGVILALIPAVFIAFFPGRIVIVSVLCYGYFALHLWRNRNNGLFTEEIEWTKSIKLFCIYLFYQYFSSFGNVWSVYDKIDLVRDIYSSTLLVLWIFLPTVERLPILLKSFVKYAIPINLFLLIVPPSDGMMTAAHNMILLNIFIFFSPYISKRNCFAILTLIFVILLFNIERRSILLGYIIPLLILLFYKILKLRIVRYVSFIVSIILPLLMLYLFASNTFNIFQEMESNDTQELKIGNRNLFVDSRSEIVEDVVNATLNSGNTIAIMFGLGGNSKIESQIRSVAIIKDGFRKNQESAMLNYIQCGGLFGLIAYSFFILYGAYNCIFKSNNKFMIMLGYFLLFKYVFSFVEDRVMMNAHTYFQFIIYGISYNKYLRMKSDFEIKDYLRNIEWSFPLKK